MPEFQGRIATECHDKVLKEVINKLEKTNESFHTT